jgi:hypothetical protein
VATSDAAATANTTVATNRSCADRDIGFPLVLAPLALCPYSLVAAMQSF